MIRVPEYFVPFMVDCKKVMFKFNFLDSETLNMFRAISNWWSNMPVKQIKLVGGRHATPDNCLKLDNDGTVNLDARLEYISNYHNRKEQKNTKVRGKTFTIQTFSSFDM